MNNVFIELTPDQIVAVNKFYEMRDEQGCWDCRFCKSRQTGPAALLSQVGSHRASEELRGKVNIIKICRECHGRVQKGISESKALAKGAA